MITMHTCNQSAGPFYVGLVVEGRPKNEVRIRAQLLSIICDRRIGFIRTEMGVVEVDRTRKSKYNDVGDVRQ